ncbi:hypothetical protein EVA_11477 [gut metagenome]|uniref:Uncharacterized protein n=1 Tax=gut metagenome TaxID=749906 RepID=J9G0Q9_9ZZZZ
MRISQKHVVLTTIVKRVSPAPRSAPLNTLTPPCTMKNPPITKRYSLPIFITSGSLVKASIIMSPNA